MSVEVRGLDDVLAALADVASAKERALTRDFCMDVATAIADEAKRIMPRDTGQMARLTGVEASNKKGGSASVRVGRDAFYWRFLEYGDGPDGIEHAFFMRAREKTFANIDAVAADRFKARLAKLVAGR